MKNITKKQEENATLPQTRGDDGDRTTNCNVAPGTGSWERKTTGMEKLGRSE